MVEAIFAIGKLLGGAGFGTIFGGVMGWLNRKVDLEHKKLEYLDREKQRTHEAVLRDKDAAILEKEFAGKIQVATVEGETKVGVEQFKAMAESYKFAQPEQGTWMAAFSSFVRPFLSIMYFSVSTIGSGYILWFAFTVAKVQFTIDQWMDLVFFVVSWFAFMAGAAIGWWYAVGAGRNPPTLSVRP